jgi:hypothetical protein
MYVRPVVALGCAHMCTVLPISKPIPQFWNVLACSSSLQVPGPILRNSNLHLLGTSKAPGIDKALPTKALAIRYFMNTSRYMYIRLLIQISRTTSIRTHVLVTLPATVPFASAAPAHPLSRPQTANSTFASADKSREATLRSVSGWSGKNNMVAT